MAEPPPPAALSHSTLLHWGGQSLNLMSCLEVWKRVHKEGEQREAYEGARQNCSHLLTRQNSSLGAEKWETAGQPPGRATCAQAKLWEVNCTCSLHQLVLCTSFPVLSPPFPSLGHPRIPCWHTLCSQPSETYWPLPEHLGHVQHATNYSHPLASIIYWASMISYSCASCGGSWKLNPCPEEVEGSSIVEEGI